MRATRTAIALCTCASVAVAAEGEQGNHRTEMPYLRDTVTEAITCTTNTFPSPTRVVRRIEHSRGGRTVLRSIQVDRPEDGKFGYTMDLFFVRDKWVLAFHKEFQGERVTIVSGDTGFGVVLRDRDHDGLPDEVVIAERKTSAVLDMFCTSAEKAWRPVGAPEYEKYRARGEAAQVISALGKPDDSPEGQNKP